MAASGTVVPLELIPGTEKLGSTGELRGTGSLAGIGPTGQASSRVTKILETAQLTDCIALSCWKLNLVLPACSRSDALYLLGESAEGTIE